MAVGPLELILITLQDESKTLPLSQQLKEVRKKGIIRLVDMLYFTKDLYGTLQYKEMSDLNEAEKVEYGTLLKGLMSMTAANRSAGDKEQISQALAGPQGKFGLTDEQFKRIADAVNPGGSAMLVLFEHTWAVGLREAIINAGGKTVMQVRLNPSALEVGGATLEEAIANAARIEADAESQAAARLAEISAAKASTEEQVAAKLAEAERILKESKMIAAANIVASVRAASIELDEANQILDEAQAAAAAEVAYGKLQAEEMIEEAEMISAAEVMIASEELADAEEKAGRILEDADRIAASEIVAGAIVADEIVHDAEGRATQITTGAQVAADEIIAGAEMGAEDDEEM